MSRYFTILACVLSVTCAQSAWGFGRKPANPPLAPAPAPAPSPTPAPTPKPSPSPAIPAPTPGRDFTSCNRRLGTGSWNFGSAPAACSVDPAQSPAYAKAQYRPVLYVEGARSSYMNEMYAVAREVGTYYLRRRNPRVSAAELEGFLAGFFTLLNQETYFTHYRLGEDSILRYMRGDSLHGYGIMQVDDRSHSVAISQGRGVDLVENMIYGLDIFYAQWVRAASASCVPSPSHFEERARSAWAAYNGGPGSICRWTNPNSAWAANDKGYFSKYRARAWRGFVADPAKEARLDVVCLAEGARPCAVK